MSLPTVFLSERDREVLRSFALRVDPADAGSHNNLGVLYYNKGMIPEAVEAFTRALALDPQMSTAERNLRIAWCDSGAFAEQVRVLGDRLAADEADRDARDALANAYLMSGDFDRAVVELERLADARPDDVETIVRLARAEQRLGHMDAASTWLRRALGYRDGDPQLLMQFADVSYHRGLDADALAALERVVERAPHLAEAHFLLGFVLGDLGRHEEAREATRRALRLNPSLGRAQPNLSLGRDAPLAPTPAGEHDEPAPLEGGALAHFNLGIAFRQKGYYQEALREYRLAIDRGEDRALVAQAMAEVHLLTRETGAAVTLYDRLVGSAPHSPKLWNERGVVLHQAGRIADARASYERAVSADPVYALALNNLGVAHYHAGRHDLACDAFRQAMLEQPAFVKARLNLALLLFRRKEFTLCLEAYRQVLTLEPDHAVAWNGIGLVLSELHQIEDARNAFGRAIDARPDYAEAHYNLSFALSHLGDYAGGLRETKRALELDPFYVPQKFELAIDLQYENPRVAIAPELGADQRLDGAVDEFTLDVGALETLFDELAPATHEELPAVPGAEGYAGARAAVSAGDLSAAAAETNRVLAAGGARGEGLVLLGDIFMRQGAFGEALDRYRQARTADPADLNAAMGEVRALLLLGRGSEGSDLAEEVAARATSEVDALLLVAQVRAERGAHGPALAALDTARRLAPARADVQKEIGDVARAAGDDDRALAAYRAAVALDRGFAAARVDLAALLRGRGAVAEAERELEATVRDLPAFVDAALELADLRRARGRPEDTIDVLVKVLRRDPYQLDALASLGESLFQCDRRGDAGVAFARVLRFDPDHVGALYFDGVLLGKQRRFEEAVARWHRVIDLEPASDYARRARRDARIAVDLQRIFVAHERRGAA